MKTAVSNNNKSKLVSPLIVITKTCPCNKQRVFSAVKIDKFHDKTVDIFNIFSQNIDSGYTLEPPRQGSSNEYPQSMF